MLVEDDPQLCWPRASIDRLALSKPLLYQQVLHRPYTRLDRGLDVHICNLRRKLGHIGRSDIQLQAVRNQGYLLTLKAT